MNIRYSILIPCFNENFTINQLVEKIINVGLDNYEIIIVDDHSTDGTLEILKELEPKYSFLKVVYLNKNQGKGNAINIAFKESKGEVIIIQDADLEYEPKDYKKLLNPIENNLADVVYGSRFLGNEVRVLYYWHRVANFLLTTLSNVLTNLNMTDMETCYKVFKREILEKINITEKRFGIEPEITAKISKLKIRIYEVGISYHGRTYEEGKKIGFRDGLRAIYCILKYNLFVTK